MKDSCSCENVIYNIYIRVGGQPTPAHGQNWQQAKYTHRVSKLLLRNCVQAHDNCLEVLPHINLYLSTRRPQTIGSPGHVTPSFLKFYIFKNSVFQDQDIFSENRQEIIKKNRGAAPRSPSLRPLPPTKVSAKCLAAVVLAHHDRVLSQQWSWHYKESLELMI